MRPRQHADRRGDKQEEGNKRHMGHNLPPRACGRPAPTPPARPKPPLARRTGGGRATEARQAERSWGAGGGGHPSYSYALVLGAVAVPTATTYAVVESRGVVVFLGYSRFNSARALLQCSAVRSARGRPAT